MLIQTDSNELGDKRLNPEEGVAKTREECLAMAALKRLPGQDELEDPKRAFGPRLQFTEVISRLRRIIPSLKVLEGSPGSVALYVPLTHHELKEAVRAWQNDRDIFFLHHKYVGGFPKQELPEYSTVDFDTSRLATKENRGWRSVLIPFIQHGLVTYQAVIKEFGDVGTDRRGWRWKEQTAQWRNNPEVKFST